MGGSVRMSVYISVSVSVRVRLAFITMHVQFTEGAV